MRRAVLLQPTHVGALVNLAAFYSTIQPHRSLAQVLLARALDFAYADVC
jgi:hypothetical protein